MLIKYGLITFIFILFLPVYYAQAEEDDYINGNTGIEITERIESFFSKNPNKKRVLWYPEIKGKSRYALSIPKDGYLASKKYSDSSDLYYLSRKIDNGLNLQLNKLKYLDIIMSKNKSKLFFKRNSFYNINVGLFHQKSEKKSYGLTIDKDLIISRNALSNFGLEQSYGEYTKFDVKFVKLTNNENSEFYGNLNYKFKSDILNVGIGNTWFDIGNQFDFTVYIQEQDRKVVSDVYATLGNDSARFQIGLNQIKNTSNVNVFLNLKFENTLNNKNFGTNVILTSKESISGLRNLSLKSFRKKNLDKLWRKYINFN